jgi:DNA ligase 1
MDFQKLVEIYEQLEKTASGNEMRKILADFFKKVDGKEIGRISYLTLGQICAEYENVVIGMAEKSVLKAISVAGGTEISKVKNIFQETGDVGLTAEKVLQKKPQTLIPLGKLTVDELFEKLNKIAEMSGAGSQDLKTNTLAALLQKSSAGGAKYVTRIVLSTLRMGVGDMTVLDALAIAFTGEKKKDNLERTYNICPDVGIIAETMATKGISGLSKIVITVGRPIKMMLAQRVALLAEIKKKMPGEVTVEGKYDGERIQAHRDKSGRISLFSRQLDNVTAQFPDLVDYLAGVKATEFIVEGEVVAIDDNGQQQPFQVLMQRRRKYEVEEYIKKIPVQLKVFDLLFLDGESWMEEPYAKRSERVSKLIKKGKHLTITDKLVTNNLEKIDDFFHKMLELGYEGIIVKCHEGEYQAGTRGWNWIKWKKEYVQELSDTFDLVVVGAYHGKGRRSGRYGALLCAAYNQEEDSFETICKLGTGLTDQMLEELPQKLKRYQVGKKPGRLTIKKEMQPDVWFSPHLVVEVLAAEVTQSPFHTAGVALRFPRFLRFREKKPEQATTVKEIKEIGIKT